MNTHSTANTPTKCDQCGDVIDTTTWHPATIGRNGDGHLFTFCGKKCQKRWQRQ